MLPFECLNYNTSFHIGALATFRPTECLIGLASYLPRAAQTGWSRTRTSVLFDMGKGRPWSCRAPGPVT
jgi:hypothetical protein